MDILSQAAKRIVEEQASIIGPLAVEQAKKVSGLHIDLAKSEVSIDGDKTAVLENLVSQYEKLFGRASVEVCRQAISEFVTQIPADQVPAALR